MLVKKTTAQAQAGLIFPTNHLSKNQTAAGFPVKIVPQKSGSNLIIITKLVKSDNIEQILICRVNLLIEDLPKEQHVRRIRQEPESPPGWFEVDVKERESVLSLIKPLTRTKVKGLELGHMETTGRFHQRVNQRNKVPKNKILRLALIRWGAR